MKKIFTIPNVLSMFRLSLIPVIVYLLLFTKLTWLAGLVILVSGITDLVDGLIARSFNQVSNLGKILDPVADKSTLVTVLGCVVYMIPVVIVLLTAEIIKDLLVATSGCVRMWSNRKVHSAEWEGKICTALVYGLILTSLFITFPTNVFEVLTIITSSIIVLLGVIYFIENVAKIS